MHQQAARVRIFVAALAALAGFVDAVGFLSVGGYFVSFMSGNSTRLAVGMASLAPSVVIPASLILSFVIGVISGEIIGQRWSHNRYSAVLAWVTVVLGAAALSSHGHSTLLPVLLAALAMGATNTAFAGSRAPGVGTTYMTGTLVHVGKGIAALMRGDSEHHIRRYFFHWLALVAGGLGGALLQPLIGLGCLWIAVGWAFALAVFNRSQ